MCRGFWRNVCTIASNFISEKKKTKSRCEIRVSLMSSKSKRSFLFKKKLKKKRKKRKKEKKAMRKKKEVTRVRTEETLVEIYK